MQEVTLTTFFAEARFPPDLPRFGRGEGEMRRECSVPDVPFLCSPRHGTVDTRIEHTSSVTVSYAGSRPRAKDICVLHRSG